MRETPSCALTQGKGFSLVCQYMDGTPAMDCANFSKFFPFSKIVQGGLSLLVIVMDSRAGSGRVIALSGKAKEQQSDYAGR